MTLLTSIYFILLLEMCLINLIAITIRLLVYLRIMLKSYYCVIKKIESENFTLWNPIGLLGLLLMLSTNVDDKMVNSPAIHAEIGFEVKSEALQFVFLWSQSPIRFCPDTTTEIILDLKYKTETHKSLPRSSDCAFLAREQLYPSLSN